jgi:hypothetical protein
VSTVAWDALVTVFFFAGFDFISGKLDAYTLEISHSQITTTLIDAVVM